MNSITSTELFTGTQKLLQGHCNKPKKEIHCRFDKKEPGSCTWGKSCEYWHDRAAGGKPVGGKDPKGKGKGKKGDPKGKGKPVGGYAHAASEVQQGANGTAEEREKEINRIKKLERKKERAKLKKEGRLTDGGSVPAAKADAKAKAKR